MESMAWDMERNLSHENMKMKLRASPSQLESKFHATLRISWLAVDGTCEVGATVVDRTYDDGLDVLNADSELQKCRLACDVFNVFSHVRALGILGRWGDQIVGFSNDAIVAARESCSLGVELQLEVQVRLRPRAEGEERVFVSARRKRRNWLYDKMRSGECGGKEDYRDENCPICLDGLGHGGGPAIWTPCAHVFHDSCLKLWLKKKKICPICRMKF